MVSLFWCVGVWVVSVCGWLTTVGGVKRLGGCLLKLARKEKRNLPTWKLDLDFVTASLQTTAGVAKGVSRFSGTGLLAVWV